MDTKSDPLLTHKPHVMTPSSEKARCTSREPDIGYQCQLPRDHRGKHKFWKEIPLVAWE